MKEEILTIVLIIISLILITCQNSFSQVNQAWVARYNGPGDTADVANAIVIDNSGNVYVVGGSYGSGSIPDFITIKYNSSGSQQWIARYNERGNATSIVLDDSGNAYVTGSSSTIKYSSSGTVKWVVNHSGGLIAVDALGNVFVTGSSFGGDYVTTKFNSAGLQQWVQYYNGTGNTTDFPSSIAVDDSGNVYVTGNSSGGIEYDYTTIKYNTAGDSLWVARFNGQGSGYSPEQVSSLAVDDSGYVYVTGSSGSPGDFATLKYDSSGDSVWVRKYNGPGNPTDYATSIAVDEAGNVYVTGYSYGSGINGEYATIKYDSSGDSVWVRRYNGPGNSYGFGRALAIDDSGNVYVTGYCTGSGTAYDYTTIKYNSTGVQQWIESYNGPGNSHDYSVSIVADNSGNVYITGYSYGDGTDYDFATIKYSQLTGIIQLSSGIPEHFSLSQNYPNPFNPVTNLEFGISELGFVSLKVYDVLGKVVATLVNEKLSPGNYKVEFDGSGLTSGVYYYRLTAGDITETKRMMLVK